MRIIEKTTPPNSIYSDVESIFSVDSLSNSDIEYESDFSNYFEEENKVYEFYLQKLLVEEECKLELLLQTSDYLENSEESDIESTTVRSLLLSSIECPNNVLIVKVTT